MGKRTLLGRRWTPALALLAGVFFFAMSAKAACDPNTEVCSETWTLISTQQYEEDSGSAGISFYPVPGEKGNRKGVSLWVFGFGDPKAADVCLEKAPGSGEFAIGDADVPDPVRLGFDHYEVDFCDPTDYLQRNALVVKELIKDEISPTLQDGEKFSVLGNSMGGLITRYVLTQLEAEGFDHGVDLWITNDSPHKGAYIPLSVQFLGSIAAISGDPSVTKALALVDGPSSRQMLVAHHLGFPLGQPHSDHDAFFDELEQLGNFPQASGLRSVAIASGAGTGSASHRIQGARVLASGDLTINGTLRYSVGEIFEWVAPFEFALHGTAGVLLIPQTQPSQRVVEERLEGTASLNGNTVFRGPFDLLTAPRIREVLAGYLGLPSFVPIEILEPPAEEIRQSIIDVILAPWRAITTVETDFGYERLAGGLDNFYSDFGGESRHTFIPTYSALALDFPPDEDLTELEDVSSHSPFTEVIFQTLDRGHTVSESDVGCREQRRLAGVPYITGVEPGTRVEGESAFTLTVHGGNFTSQSVVSWEGTKLPTTFISDTQLSAEVSFALQVADPEQPLLLPDEPFSPPLPVIVSVNNYDSEGKLLMDHFYADEANCTIGVVVRENAINITPSVPTTNDQITAVIAGDRCTGGPDPQVAISGNQITITITGDSRCLAPSSPFDMQATFGPLPAAVYEVILQIVDLCQICGGATTEIGRRSFEVTYPVPSISLLQPDRASAASPGFMLIVEGTDFQPPDSKEESTVYWNGSPRLTTFINDGELHASISAADIAAQGTAEVTVRTGETLISEPMTFTITEPLPVIASLDPASVVEDSGSFSLKVIGERFAPDALVLWTTGEGATEQLATIFVSATELETTVPASLITTPGLYPVGVLSNGTTSAAEYLVVEPSDATNSPAIGAATNGASFTGGVSPGGIATIFGENLANTTEQAARIPLPTSLGGAQVFVAGVAAPLFYVSPAQINFQVPFEAPLGATAPVQVVRDDVAGPESSMLIAEYALGIFFYEREPGVRDPVITHADGSLVTPSSPATPDEVLIVYATGVGSVENPPPTGAASRAEPLATSTLMPQVLLGGASRSSFGTAQFVGLTPGFVGLIQMNIQLPSTRPPGPLKLGIRFHEEENYLFVPIPVAEN